LVQHFSESEDPFLNLYKQAAERANPPRRNRAQNFEKQRRFYVVYQMIRHVLDRGSEGDVAECGCWHGHSAYIIASVLSDKGPRTLWVFDSFEGGLSDKIDQDREAIGDTSPEKTLAKKQHYASNFEQVKALLAEKTI